MYIYLILIIISLIMFNIDKILNIEHYNNNIFIRSDILFNILKADEDNYYKSFFKNDLYARKINNIDNYIKLIEESIDNFNTFEKNKIKSCIYEIDKIFNKINLEWFNGKKVNKISWKIGCIKGKLYENGLPHTRNDIILISKDSVNNMSYDKLKKTLIHEKVHIYQKIYLDDLKKYLDKKKFVKFKKRTENDNIRANPDLDNWIYKDNNNKIYKAQYNINPTSIEDIIYYPINTQLYEHPFETMAIEIENSILL